MTWATAFMWPWKRESGKIFMLNLVLVDPYSDDAFGLSNLLTALAETPYLFCVLYADHLGLSF